MRIGVVGSMQYTEKMIEYRDRLIALGHDAYVANFAEYFIGKTDEEKEELKLRRKNLHDAIGEFWRIMQGGDAVFVVNLDKHGVANYIGGNTFAEIMFAHVLGQKIFLLNPIPEISFYKTEIEAVAPTIISGNFSLIA